MKNIILINKKWYITLAYNLLIFISILLFISFFRGHALIDNFLMNPDEAERISNALRIFNYGYSWNSVDGYSSGPLNSIVLLWPKIINMDITYFTARLTSVFLFSILILSIYKIFERYINRIFAFIIIIPLTSFYSFTTSNEFLHYSSEQLSVCFIFVTLYLIDRLNQIQTHQKSYFYIIIVAGLLLSSIPFAKLQATPVSFLLWVWIAYQIYKVNNFKRMLKVFFIFIASSLLVPIIFFAPIVVNSEIHHFYNSYIAWSLNYVSKPLDLQNFIALLSHNTAFNIMKLYIFSSAILFFLLMYFSNRLSPTIHNKLLIPVILVFFSTYYSIVAPGRGYPHYIHFFIPILIVTLGFLAGTLIKLFNQFLLKVTIYIFLLIIFSYESYQMYKHSNREQNLNNVKTIIGSIENFIYHKDLYSFIRLPKNNELKLLSYGWMSDYYLSKDTIPASREGMNQNQIQYSDLQSYFRNRLMHDISQSEPHVIIDAVYKGAFGFDSKKQNGIKSFPELYEKVKNEYSLMSFDENSEDKPTIYLRNSYLEELSNNMIRIKDIQASGFYNENVHYRNVNDFSIFEKSSYGKTIFDYWVLPDNTLGSIKFNFYDKEELECVKVLNTTNGHFAEKSTKEISLKVFSEKKLIYSITKILNKYPVWTNLDFPKLQGVTSVTIDILSYEGSGAGLNEVKFYRESGENNVEK